MLRYDDDRWRGLSAPASEKKKVGEREECVHLVPKPKKEELYKMRISCQVVARQLMNDTTRAFLLLLLLFFVFFFLSSSTLLLHRAAP